MNLPYKWKQEKPVEIAVPEIKDFGRVADDIYKHALNDARQNLHPLLRQTKTYQLHQRHEFMDAFKLALERRIAQKIAIWHPDVQAVFKFDESWMETRRRWDGTIHLLVQVPRLSNRIKLFGKKLDHSLADLLRQLGWARFRKSRSILEIQQVTPNEVRHGIGYGAMFYAVYSVPVKVWSPKR